MLNKLFTHITLLINYLFWNCLFKKFDYGARVSLFANITGYNNIKIGRYSRIMSGVIVNSINGTITIGRNTIINEYTVIKPTKRQVVIGDNCSIQQFCKIIGGIRIGNYTRIASGCAISAFNHEYINKSVFIRLQGIIYKDIKLGNDVWIGSNVSILNGVQIEDGVVIGANSLINKDISSFSVVAGNPFKVIKKRV